MSSLLGNNVLAGAAGNPPPYTIDQSMYFGDAPSTGPKLSRQFNQTGSTNPKWTFATWWKKGRPTTSAKTLYYFRPLTVNAGADVEFTHANDLPGEGAGFRSNAWSGSSSPWDWNTNLKDQFRDYSAWYHVCHVIDYETSPYVFLYINGVLQDINTIYGTKTGAGYATDYSPVSGDTFFIGSNYSNQCGNAYFADTYWIEQQALNPVGTFGEFNKDTDQFVPIKYTGTYSGNSFYLNYSDASDFGADSSGLGNDFTVASIAAGNQRPDTPTNSFSTLNPLVKQYSVGTFQEGNLKTTLAADGQWAFTTAVKTGKWYLEFCPGTSNGGFGVVGDDSSRQWNGAQYPQDGTGHIFYWYDGNKNIDATTSSYGDTFTNGDIIGMALNLDDSEVKFYKNGTVQNSGTAISFSGTITSADLMIPGGAGGSGTLNVNAGADSSFAGRKTAQGNQDGNGKGDFYYEPPSGYLALCTDNLSDPEIALPGEHFNTVLYTGNGGGSTDAITGVGFQPDLNWIKGRTNATSNYLTDSVRGIAGSGILSDSTAAPDGIERIASLDSDGFTTAGTLYSYVNTSSANYVAWNWKAATTNSGSTSGSGTTKAYSSSTSATAGFSIIKYVGNGTSGIEVPHHLGVAPQCLIAKNLDRGSGGGSDWHAWHTGFGTQDKYIWLNHSNPAYASSNYFTAVSSTTFTLGTDTALNVNDEDFICYAFTGIEGYSKFGSYEGNGNSNGPFMYTGFRPGFVMLKNIETSTNWPIVDSKRSPYNIAHNYVFADNTNAEESGVNAEDFLSNGWKIRTDSTEWNQSGKTYIYLAFAESPFKYSNAR